MKLLAENEVATGRSFRPRRGHRTQQQALALSLLPPGPDLLAHMPVMVVARSVRNRVGGEEMQKFLGSGGAGREAERGDRFSRMRMQLDLDLLPLPFHHCYTPQSCASKITCTALRSHTESFPQCK